MTHPLPACCFVLACMLLPVAPAYSQKSFIEYSMLSTSDTLHKVNTLGFYNVFSHKRNYSYYAGLDFALFEPKDALDNELDPRIVIGISGVDTIAPYAEVGIGLYDTLFRGKEDSQSCSDENDCEPDVHFRVGLRIRAINNVSFGVFYEGVSFGDFQDRLSGAHSYTGTSISVKF